MIFKINFNQVFKKFVNKKYNFNKNNWLNYCINKELKHQAFKNMLINFGFKLDSLSLYPIKENFLLI